MAYKLDFDDIRARVSIERVAEWLGVAGLNERLRGECPLCHSTKDNPFTLTPSKGMWGCFACGKKGNIFHFVMHMREVELKDAAQLIHDHFLGTVQSKDRDSTVQRDSTVRGTDGERGLKPLEYLDAEHPGVDAVGFDQDFATKHGIGYASKGIARGHVLIPFRDETGVLLGYIGTTEELWLPKEFKPADPKVVPLKRPA